ncbi:uncharacterized protein LOC115929347 [Strongylocentrotus purpuratus]|uniref:Uncharacterized protein n=1 Tax=Strongylocentrotus purpuratus TaxID=7668 RepID=A0A7M7PMM4_STRPU|nr:uncharacterized protein LOC115929347 [Strongylocentrotus purpuratus]
MCEPYLKPMDSSNSVPTNHRLLIKLRRGAIKAYVNTHAWDKAIEMGRLLNESLRYHYGPFSPILGTYLMGIGNALLELRRLQEAEKYLTEAKNVLEVTHGPKHALMLEVQEMFVLLEILKT